MLYRDGEHEYMTLLSLSLSLSPPPPPPPHVHETMTIHVLLASLFIYPAILEVCSASHLLTRLSPAPSMDTVHMISEGILVLNWAFLQFHFRYESIHDPWMLLSVVRRILPLFSLC
ncbi:hypothetical protein ABZP36_029190 [Zizania latifolia]